LTADSINEKFKVSEMKISGEEFLAAAKISELENKQNLILRSSQFAPELFRPLGRLKNSYH